MIEPPATKEEIDTLLALWGYSRMTRHGIQQWAFNGRDEFVIYKNDTISMMIAVLKHRHAYPDAPSR